MAVTFNSPAGALSTAIHPIGTGTSNAVRVPMQFTSTYRRRLINPAYKVTPNDGGQQIFTNNSNTPTAAIGTTLPVISMAVNPNSVTWAQSKRITKRDVQDGSVFFHFSNKNGENNDILELSFRGNTGNLNTNSDSTGQAGSPTGASNKLFIWHNLWALTRERMLLDDGTENVFVISYASPAIPTIISLYGHFKEVMTWEDSAEKPFSKDYSFTFVVRYTAPDLNDVLANLTTTFNDGINTVAGLA